MVPPEEARQIYVDDIVNTVGQTFLATTMRCFKCHDHKFDPLPTKDYYRVYATFEGTQLAERPVDFLPEENLEGMEEGRAMTEELLNYAKGKLKYLTDKQEAAAKKWFEDRGLEYVEGEARKNLPDEEKPPRDVGLNYIEEGRLKVRKQDVWIWTRRLERYEAMAQSVYNASPAKGAPNARKLRMPKERDAEATLESYIFMGGALSARGEKVRPGVLSAIGVPVGENSGDPYVMPDTLDGRRLAFARWVADPDNSLATRSIVNRLLQRHLGKPIAGNPNNFGAKGGKPTHPKLLDWLAADLVENGWTLKRLHRLIMMSETYRQSGKHPDMDTLAAEDPNNDLFAFYPPRRLSAEELRDGMLKITGELNTKMGGLPVMPEINMEVALQPRMIQFSLAPAHQPFRTPEARNRRSIYAYRVRGQADPFLELFNQPNPNESCEARDSVSVSPQAFTLLNSDLVNDRAIAFAKRLEAGREVLGEQVEYAFELSLGRGPSPSEKRRMQKYVKHMIKYHQKVEPDPVEYPMVVVRSLVEEFSGKPFEYDEILPVFENYVADAKAIDVAPKTRALADLCLLLFNSNEFVYVY